MIDIVCCTQRATEQYHRETFTRLVCLFISLSTLVMFIPDEPMGFAMVIFFSSLFCLVVIYSINEIRLSSHNLRTVFDRRKSHEN